MCPTTLPLSQTATQDKDDRRLKIKGVTGYCGLTWKSAVKTVRAYVCVSVDVACSDSETCYGVHSVYEQKERLHSERHRRHEEAESVS